MQRYSPHLILSVVVIFAIVCGGAWYIGSHQTSASNNTAKSKGSKTTTPSSTTNTSSFDKSKYSLTDPTSIWVVVNKQHPLQPISFVPPDLTVPNVTLRSPGEPNMQMRTVTASALEQMFAAAKKQGINLEVVSAYRSYSYQQTLYEGYVGSAGQAAADEESARPGYSEHQTGLSVDIGGTDNICILSQCFGTTPEGEWLAANAYKYGFLLRYPQGFEYITGYEYEPWHFRYIGTYLSEELHKENVKTLEQFFNVTGGTTYN